MNKETLQLYNNRLEKNNVSLQDVLDEVNALSDAPIEKLYLIRNGIEQTDVTGGHKFIEITSDTNNSNYAEVQKDGWIELCGKQWGAYGWITNNSFDFTKYVKIYVEYDFPNAPPDTAYLEFSQSHIAIMTSEDLAGAIYDSGSILPARVLTVPRKIVRCDVNVDQTSNRWCISVSNITSRTDYKNYPLRIYNVWFETDGGILEEPELQNKTITPSETQQVVTPDSEFDGLSNVIVEPIPDEYIVPNLQDKSITIIENGTQTVIADEGYDGLNSVEVVTNIANESEPVVEPDYITDGLVAWWEGEDDVDTNGHWNSRVGTDYITNAPGYATNSVSGSPYNAFYTIKKERAYQNNMVYGLVTQQDYYSQGYTIEVVGKARTGGNEAALTGNVAAPMIAFDRGNGPMIANFGANGFFACVNANQDVGMPKLFTDCYGKRYKYAITLDQIVPRGTKNGSCLVSYSLNDSQWYQKASTYSTNSTEKGNRMTILTYYWDTYKSNAEINSIRVYNRKLTEEELKHNYEVDKARFNLDEYIE